MNKLLLILAITIGVLVTIFATQNTELVRVRFLGYTTNSFPLAAVILVSASLGVVLGYVLGLRERIRQGFEARRQDTRIRDLQETRIHDLESRQMDVVPDNPSITSTEPADPHLNRS